MQKDENDKFQPIEFMSKLWTDAQQHWHITTKEIYSMIAAIRKWDRFLYKKFYVHSDAKNIEWLMKQTNKKKKTNPMH